MKVERFAMTTAVALLLAAPAAAQQATQDTTQGAAQQTTQAANQTAGTQARQEMTDEDIRGADEAADLMVAEVYVREPAATHWMPNEVIARLQELGYTNIHDFDVERGHYEVEATAPDGDDVEIEIDPVSGVILDIEDNWF